MPIQDMVARRLQAQLEVIAHRRVAEAFRAHFGLSPRAFRSQFSGDQLSRFRPEIRQRLSL